MTAELEFANAVLRGAMAAQIVQARCLVGARHDPMGLDQASRSRHLAPRQPGKPDGSPAPQPNDVTINAGETSPPEVM